MNYRSNAAPTLALTVLLFAAACQDPAPQALADSASGSATPGGEVAYLPGVAQTGLCKDLADTAHRGVTDTTVLFANKNNYYSWCIPEYHDDQRLNDGVGDYGPVAHALAHPRLAAYTNHTHFHRKFINVGIVDLDAYAGSVPSSYLDLGLTTRRSCVYLMHRHRGGTRWIGLVVPAASDFQCPTAPASTDGKIVDVLTEHHSDAHTDYPPVARFITEGSKNLSAVSFRCGNDVCALAPAGFGTMPPSAHNAIAALKSNRTGTIKSWFDDQKLAHADGTPSRFGVLAQVRASLIPDLQLGTRTLAAYEAGYLPVAKAYFPDEPPRKYKLAGFGKDTTLIELMVKIVPVGGGKMDSVWYARLTSKDGIKIKGGGPLMTRKVMRTDHGAWLTSMPATARWRWRDADEDIWVQCGVGCCLISSDS